MLLDSLQADQPVELFPGGAFQAALSRIALEGSRPMRSSFVKRKSSGLAPAARSGLTKAVQRLYITSCEDRVRACYIASSYLFVLTYTEVPWSSLMATVLTLFLSLVYSKCPPRLELPKKTQRLD